MRLLCLLFLLSRIHPAFAQFVCYSDIISIYEFPGVALPAMTGETKIDYGAYRLIIGGQFKDPDKADPGVYNCDMLILDRVEGLTYVLPLSYFPPFADDQFAGMQHCFTVDRDTAYILGGFGFDLARGVETTFPTLTMFPVKTLIDSVIQHKNYQNLFQVLESDARLAVMDGNLIRIGAYFLLYNGKKASWQAEAFTDRFSLKTWDFQGQLRKFRLKNSSGFLEVDEFQVCPNSGVFYQCMPTAWGGDPVKTIEINEHQP